MSAYESYVAANRARRILQARERQQLAADARRAAEQVAATLGERTDNQRTRSERAAL